MSYSTIVLFSDAFPYGAVTEASFIRPELSALAEKFERVIIVPTTVCGEADMTCLPDNVEIATFWIDSQDFKHKLRRTRHLFDPELWRLTSGDRSVATLKYAATVITIAGAIRRWISSEGIDLETTLFYTFWFDLAAGALALLSKSLPIRFFSRAHFHDLYYLSAPKPVARMIASSAEAIYACSVEGSEFLKNKFSDHADKIDVEFLGTTKSRYDSFASHHLSADRRLTFLSVARVAQQKRVDLNYKMLKALAVARPQTDVRWIHVGDGPLMEPLRELVSTNTLPNLSVELTGSKDNTFVQSLYQSEAIDWTVLLSEGEGLPIAACESLSYGVPVVGTMVRGIREAVDDDCGLLLAADPEPEEFVRGILPYLESDYRMNSLRSAAFDRWTNRFNAEKLRRRFVERIFKL